MENIQYSPFLFVDFLGLAVYYNNVLIMEMRYVEYDSSGFDRFGY